MRNTKKKMAGVLKELLEKKHFHKITIEELVEKTGMTRQSFYYHFADIYDLLAYLCQLEVENWFSDLDESSFTAWLDSLLLHMEGSRHLFERIFDEVRGGVIHDYIFDKMKDQFKEVIRKPHVVIALKLETEEQIDFAADFLSDSIFWFFFMKVTKKSKIEREEFAEKYAEFLSNVITE
ncbi:MAG: TetR/AcrR family transcriptional regulator [Lachnospiraceae bacterium]|nr:TetR/AcrR family transcriptional regulator [Lachnospiraceae bacterium]